MDKPTLTAVMRIHGQDFIPLSKHNEEIRELKVDNERLTDISIAFANDIEELKKLKGHETALDYGKVCYEQGKESILSRLLQKRDEIMKGCSQLNGIFKCGRKDVVSFISRPYLCNSCKAKLSLINELIEGKE